MGARSVLAALLALGLVGSIYVTRLSDAPVYLAHDEIKFALQARAIAATGHALNGDFLPLYFSEPEYTAGRDPLSIYTTALVLKALPFSVSSIRLPSALVGVLDIVLIFFVARRLFASNRAGAIAALLLATTPAHFIHSRLAVDVLWPLPFVLGWLLLLAAYAHRPTLRALVGAMLLLGIGVYSYLGGALLMPVYAAATIVVVLRTRDGGTRRWDASRWRSIAWALAGFILPLLLLAWWHLGHAGRYAELVDAYRPQGARDPFGYASLAHRLDTIWNYFNPSYLFLTGDTSLINSTRSVGPFLLPVGVLIVCGLHRILRTNRSPLEIVLVVGLLTAPLPAAMMGDIEIRRALLMLPFAILIATAGAEYLLRANRGSWRTAAILLLVAAPLMFRGFYADYIGGHRARSGAAYGGNIRGACMAVLTRRPPAAYLSRRIPYVDDYCAFYAVDARREDVLPRLTVIDPDAFDPRTAVSGSMVVSTASDEPATTLARTAGWTRLEAVPELDGTSLYVTFEKR